MARTEPTWPEQVSDPFAPKQRHPPDLHAPERAITESQLPAEQPDALIQGLLTHLPRPGEVWPETKRKLWLELVAGSFKLIYRDDGDAAP